MNFNNKLPEWKNSGTEPSDSLKNDGFKAGYKPSANVFNWFWNKTGKCIKELQEKLSCAPIPLSGVCTTAKGTTGKVVTCPDFKIYDGARIAVTFNNGNSANYMSLNVNGTGAYFAWFPIGTSRAYNNELISKFIVAGCTYEFIYQDGATPKWVYCGMTSIPINDETPTYTEAEERDNLASGEKLSTAFGKIKKWFADLKAVAFSNDYNDLDNTPTALKNPNALTLSMNGTSTSYTGESSVAKTWYAPTTAGTAGYNLISNGSGAPVWQQPPYAVCSTSGNTAVKTVSISNFKLTTGVRVLVKFTYEHTSSTAATLNVNSTGAKNIVVHCGTDNIFVKDYFSWLAGETVELVYDGSYWVAIASDMRFITGAQSATVVIGTTKTQGFCDFRCDGTNDAECFNKAIRRIKTILSRNPPKEGSMMWRYGGTILVKTGVYNINSTISIGQSITKNIFTFKGEGPFSTWIQTKDLQCFMKNFDSLCFKDLYLTCDGLNEGPYFDSGDNLTFENCYISVRNSTSNVGVFADLNTQYTGEDPGGGSSGELQQGCFVLRGSTMTIKTLSTSSNCFSGINCGVLKVDDSEINLFNNSNSTSFELNFAYLAMTGYISNSIIHCSGKSSIVNSGAINITGNVIYLHSSNSRIYHYNTSITEVGGVFNANTVYCAYYVYLRCATITGNKFLKLNEYQSNSVACYLYNPCSASITGNFFHGGASGTWYIDAASKGSLNVLCNNYKGTLAVRNTVTQNNAYNLSVNY